MCYGVLVPLQAIAIVYKVQWRTIAEIFLIL